MASIRPFLRWAGGKRWLANGLSPILAERLKYGGTYFEPFLGSGAMFFALQPDRAILSDLNEDLIATFRMVARYPEVILKRLTAMPSKPNEYERVRSWRPKTDLNRAVRFVYLNRNCYGGLYRENKHGVFNVPYGGGERNHSFICANGIIPMASMALNKPGVIFQACDFGEMLSRAKNGDVVYCDPTYRDVTRQQFDRYGKNIFHWEDQERLARLAARACDKGAVVVLSNTTCNGIRDLYRGAGVVEVMRRKGLGPQGNGQKQVEYLLILDPQGMWKRWEEIGALARPELRKRRWRSRRRKGRLSGTRSRFVHECAQSVPM